MLAKEPRSLRHCNLLFPMFKLCVHTGTEALDFLFCHGNWMGRVEVDPPRLIVLDLRLAGEDGFFVLGEIRSLDKTDMLTLISVVIFTDSQASSDITRSYRCGANSYIIKPLSFPDFETAIKTVGQYWMMHNRTSY